MRLRLLDIPERLILHLEVMDVRLGDQAVRVVVGEVAYFRSSPSIR